MLWTVRCETQPNHEAMGSQLSDISASLEVEARALAIEDGVHTCEVLSNGWGLPSNARLILRVSNGTGWLTSLPLRVNATLLLAC